MRTFLRRFALILLAASLLGLSSCGSWRHWRHWRPWRWRPNLNASQEAPASPIAPGETGDG